MNGADFANNDGDPYDDDAHGTHVSGTIAASVNGQGIAGVAPNVRIMALKALDARGFLSLSDAIEAITYAKNKGAGISNNSWGGVAFSQALKDAIEASGSLFVASAGNGGSDRVGDDNDVTPNYPSSYDSPNILAVAAIDNQGNLASFSNFGATSVDISAPGVSILSSIPGTPPPPAAALSSVGSSGKALMAGFGAEEINGATAQASFMDRAFTAVGRGTQQVVLVDDDNGNAGGSDVTPSLSAAVQSATGTAPQVITVPSNANGPTLSQLSGKTVVWATGRALDSGAAGTTLTPSDQTILTDFLNGGGKLVLTGMDALRWIETRSFVMDTLQLSVQSDLASAPEDFDGRAGTAFAGEHYDLNGSVATPARHDKVAPAGSAAVTQGIYPVGIPGTWAYFNGTSMAAPHATGAAALAASVDPALLSNPVALKDHVMNTGKPALATSGKTVTGDVVDARAAVPDIIPPTVTSVSPADKATGVALATNVSATFSEPMKAATVQRAFTLKKKNADGTTEPVAATVDYKAVQQKAVLDPNAELARGTRYIATVTTRAKDKAGNALAQKEVWSFTTRS